MEDEKPLKQEVAVRVGKLLQEAREELGMTQREVGEAVGKSEAVVSRLEAGLHSYPIGLVRDIAKVLKIPSIAVTFELDRPESANSPLLRRIGQMLDDARRQRARTPGQDPGGADRKRSPRVGQDEGS